VTAPWKGRLVRGGKKSFLAGESGTANFEVGIL